MSRLSRFNLNHVFRVSVVTRHSSPQLTAETMNSTSSSSTASYRPTPALSSYRSASVAVAEEDEPVIEGATSTSSSAVAQHHRTSSPTPHTSSSLSSSSTRTDDQETDTATATATAAPPAATTASARRPRTAPERTLSSLPRKKCWICFGEQSEEDQGSAEARREWVHACRCTLVAHSDVSVSLGRPSSLSLLPSLTAEHFHPSASSPGTPPPSNPSPPHVAPNVPSAPLPT